MKAASSSPRVSVSFPSIQDFKTCLPPLQSFQKHLRILTRNSPGVLKTAWSLAGLQVAASIGFHWFIDSCSFTVIHFHAVIQWSISVYYIWIYLMCFMYFYVISSNASFVHFVPSQRIQASQASVCSRNLHQQNDLCWENMKRTRLTRLACSHDVAIFWRSCGKQKEIEHCSINYINMY